MFEAEVTFKKCRSTATSIPSFNNNNNNNNNGKISSHFPVSEPVIEYSAFEDKKLARPAYDDTIWGESSHWAVGGGGGGGGGGVSGGVGVGHFYYTQ